MPGQESGTGRTSREHSPGGPPPRAFAALAFRMAVLPGEEDRILGTCCRVRHAVCTQEPLHLSPFSFPGWPWTLLECGTEQQLLPAEGFATGSVLADRAFSSAAAATQPQLTGCAFVPAALELMIPTDFLLHPAAQGPGGLPIKLQEDTFWAFLVP